MSIPNFWATPFRYLRYVSHEKPAIFYSLVLGFAGPAFLLVIPIRHKLGFEDHPPIPKTWPIPNRARVPVPSTYDDPK